MVQFIVSANLRIDHTSSSFRYGAEIPRIIYQSGDEMNSFIPTIPLPAYFCSIDTKTLRGSLMPMR